MNHAFEPLVDKTFLQEAILELLSRKDIRTGRWFYKRPQKDSLEIRFGDSYVLDFLTPFLILTDQYLMNQMIDNAKKGRHEQQQ